MRGLLSIGLLICILGSFFGIAEQFDQAHADLDLTLRNETGEQLDQAAIFFGTNRCSSGIIGKGMDKTYIGWEKPITTNAIIRWRDGKLKQKEAVVSLVGVYKPKLEGRLIFTIMPPNSATNVTVVFKPPIGRSHFSE